MHNIIHSNKNRLLIVSFTWLFDRYWPKVLLMKSSLKSVTYLRIFPTGKQRHCMTMTSRLLQVFRSCCTVLCSFVHHPPLLPKRVLEKLTYVAGGFSWRNKGKMFVSGGAARGNGRRESEKPRPHSSRGFTSHG